MARASAQSTVVGQPPMEPCPQLPQPHNPVDFRFPQARTRFVGRRRAIEDLLGHLTSTTPLVTVIGPGGSGKTRLVMEAHRLWCGGGGSSGQDPVVPPSGAQALHVGPRGCANVQRFVDLTACSNLTDVLDQVAESLGTTSPQDPRAAIEHIAEVLNAIGNGWLVLDNAERAVEPLRRALTTWVPSWRGCITVTSRTALGLYGEQRLSLSSLTPTESEALFVDRAGLIQAPCQDDPAVPALMDHLGGLPLAIELAAARCNVLPPSQLLDRLSQGLHALRSTDQPPRHQSLASVLDASWDLLSADEQHILAAVSAFPDGFTLGAAQRLLSPNNDVSETLDGLGRSSWVQQVSISDVVRFELPPLTRRYCTGKLKNVTERAIERATEWVLEWGEEQLARWPGAAERRRAIIPELRHLNHVRATSDRPDHVLRACVIVVNNLLSRGPYDGFLRQLADALAAWPHTDEIKARAQHAMGRVLRQNGDHSGAISALREAELWALNESHSELLVRSQVELAFLFAWTGDQDAAQALFESAHHLADGLDDGVLRGVALAGLGGLAFLRVLPDEARRNLTAAIAIARQSRDAETLFRATVMLGRVEVQQARLPEAVRSFELAAQVLPRVDCPRMACMLTRHLAVNYGHLHQLDKARVMAERGVAIARRVGDQEQLVYALGGLTDVLFECHAFREAAIAHAERIEITRTTTAGYTPYMRITEALLRMANGDIEGARPILELGLREMSTAPAPNRARFLGWLALQAAAAGEFDRCEATVRRAIQLAGDQLNPARALFLRICAAVGSRGRAVRDGDMVLAARETAVLDTLTVRAMEIGDLPCRVAVGEFWESGQDRPDGLSIDSEGNWFCRADGTTVHLTKRRAIRRILGALASIHGTRETLDWEDLFHLGWPGELANPTSARQRVYVSVSTLRKMGLDGHLIHKDDGYVLAGAVQIVRPTAAN